MDPTCESKKKINHWVYSCIITLSGFSLLNTHFKHFWIVCNLSVDILHSLDPILPKNEKAKKSYFSRFLLKLKIPKFADTLTHLSYLVYGCRPYINYSLHQDTGILSLISCNSKMSIDCPCGISPRKVFLLPSYVITGIFVMSHTHMFDNIEILKLDSFENQIFHE